MRLIQSIIVLCAILFSLTAVATDLPQCYALKALRDVPDESHWVKAHAQEAADLPAWKVRQVYNESIAQRYIRSGERVLVFRPHAYKYYLYENGRLVRSGVANGGKTYCPDVGRSCRTPAGVYRVYREGGAGCKSSK